MQPALSTTNSLSHTSGIFLFFCGLITFAVFDAGSKYFLAFYPAPLLNVLRYSTVSVFAIFLLFRHGIGPLPKGRILQLLVLRGVMLGIVGTAFMTALTWMPLAEATAIYFTSPLIIVALSAWLLSEQVGRTQWIAVLAGLMGMLLIVRPGNELPVLGTVLMALAAFSFALFQLLTRKLSGLVPGHIQYATTAFICWIITAIPVPFFLPEVWPDFVDLSLIIWLGILNAAGQMLLLAAFQRVPASTLAPYNYCQLLMAVVISLFLFNQAPDSLALGGIALIIAAGVFLAHRTTASLSVHPTKKSL